MPRATRLMPIAMPMGTAVNTASTKAAATRSRLAARCCHKGLSLAVPLTYSMNCCATACGLGRNRGLINPAAVMPHHSKNSAAMVATLMAALAPSPGVRNELVFCASGIGDLSGALVHVGQHLFAQGNEVGG